MSLGGYFSLPYRVGEMSDRGDGGLFSRLVIPPCSYSLRNVCLPSERPTGI